MAGYIQIWLCRRLQRRRGKSPLPRPEMEVSRRRRGKESERGTGHDDGKKRTDADGLKWTQVAPPLLRDWMRLQIEILAVRAQRTHT